MVQPNWWLLFVVALIPLAIGSIWYHPKVLGRAWMQSAEISEERATSGNMIKIFAFTYLFSLFATYLLTIFSIHQSALVQLFLGDPALEDTTSAMSQTVNEFMTTYGDRHRTWSHGVIHGMELALLLGLPFIGIHSLFERRSFKYIWIHVGYWVLCFAIMGAILCTFF